jgi:predicted amidohydrolase YtcJ
VSVVPADLGIDLRARAAGTLTARAALYFEIQGWRAVADTLARIGRGDDWVWIGGVKAYVDGSLGSRTALFSQPYADDPETAGLLRTPEDSLRAWIGGADSAGLQVTVHAIGERANELILDIYDSVAAAHGARDRRFRIEHAQHLRLADVDRIARSGVIASMQPSHAIDDGRSRRTLDGKHPDGWIPEQKISVEEALRAYTTGGGYGVFAERRRGRLRPGFKADLVLLGRDLTRIPPEAIERVAVRTTVTGGRVVYQAR